jgi:hypothetical protein
MKKGMFALVLSGLLAFAWATSTAAAPTNIGAEKCKMCHKVQYDSWVKTKHATNDPKVDCETCHGPGSDYKSMAVMKDTVKAKAAGLIVKPEKATCTAKCHKDKWTDDMFAKSHAHKAK